MKEKISILGIVVNFLLAVAKIIIGILAKANSILADGINSGTDVFASVVNYIGIRTAKKPADKEHPYGHEKAEVLSGFIITIVIFISSLFIIYDAIKGFFKPEIASLSTVAFVVMASSALINFIMSKLKIYYGKKYNSVSLISDGVHSRIDVLTSLGVFIGLFFIKYWLYLDSLLALLIGLYVAREAFKLGKESTDSLLGKSDKETEEKIREILKQEKIDLVDLKTQKLGSKAFAEITIRLPAKLKVEEAEALTKKLEEKLTSQIKNLEYTSIQIKSHHVEVGYYKPAFGRGFGWRRRGKFKEEFEEARGAGPGGDCICKKCGYRQKHEKGIPCSTLKCPKCGISLIRG